MGGVTSFTVTVNVQVEVLFDASRAVTVTVVVPFGNKLPEAGDAVTVVPGQLSLAAGNAKFTNAPHWPGELLTVMLAGQVMVGAWVSFTRTTNEQVPPPGSVATTVVLPMGKKEPEAGEVVTGPQAPDVVGAG